MWNIFSSYDTAKTISPVYQAQYDYAGGKKVKDMGTFQISENIVDIQNALSTKNGKTLTEALKAYIDANNDTIKMKQVYLCH